MLLFFDALLVALDVGLMNLLEDLELVLNGVELCCLLLVLRLRLLQLDLEEFGFIGNCALPKVMLQILLNLDGQSIPLLVATQSS